MPRLPKANVKSAAMRDGLIAFLKEMQIYAIGDKVGNEIKSYDDLITDVSNSIKANVDKEEKKKTLKKMRRHRVALGVGKAAPYLGLPVGIAIMAEHITHEHKRLETEALAKKIARDCSIAPDHKTCVKSLVKMLQTRVEPMKREVCDECANKWTGTYFPDQLT